MAGMFDDLLPAGDKPSGLTFEDLVAGNRKPASQVRAEADAAKRIKSAPDQVRALNKGFSFGFADEADAAGAALETGANNIFRKMTGKPSVGYGMGDAYHAVIDANKNADATFAQKHPVQSAGLQVAGSMVGPGVAAGARYIGGARSLVGATARSAVVGGAMGAAAGAGNTDGDLAQRAVGAGKGAVEGAVIGAALPGAGRVAQTAGRAANAAVGQPFGGAQRGAVARLREAMQQDGLSPQQIAQAALQWQQSGVTPEFLNVVGENTRALIRAAGSQPGEARTAAQGYRNATVASIPNRAIERTNALTPGETRTPARFAADTRAQRRVDANTRYAGPNATPVDINGPMAEAMRGTTGRAAIAEARRVAEINGDHAVMNELDQLPDGDLSSFPQMTGRTLDAVRRALRDMGRSEARNGANGASAGYGNRVQQMDTGLDNVPGLTAARGHYRAQSQGIDAAEGGASVMGPRSEFQPEVAAQANNPFAVSGAQIRERQALRDHFGTRDQVRGRLADIAHAPDVRPNLEQLYGQEGARFADAAGNLVQKQDHANFIAPNTGSQTFSRGHDNRNIFGTAKAAMEVLGGNLRPLVERLARGLTMTERERALLVQYGIGTPADAVQALTAAPGRASQVGGNVYRRLSAAAPPAAVSEIAGN
jgi:hypothetical protein